MSIKTDAQNAALDALQDVAEQVLEQARRNTPVGDPRLDPDPGRSLKRSGRIERDGNGFVVIFDGPYAAKQHEDLQLKHPRGGGPKFLERAVLQVVPSVEGVVASRVRARTATGLSGTAGRSHHARRS